MKYLVVGATMGAALWLQMPAQGAGRCEASSPAHTLALIELYTSEGCDSCPPADKWLRNLRGEGLGKDSVVPVSLHVDYWDYIGWKDPFAKPQFSARQRAMAQVQKNNVVYTPQVMLAGRDYRGWARGGLAADVKAINRQPARADIRLELKSASGDKVELVVEGRTVSAEARDLRLFVAWYENGLSSPVSAGENRGAVLRHDFVVREWIGPLEFTNGAASITRTIGVPGKPDMGGAAAFVQDLRSGEVLQALSLPYCGSAG